MKLYPIGWFSAPSSSFSLFSGRSSSSRSDPTLDQVDFDEQVFVNGRQVVWSAGLGGTHRIYKSYGQVLSAKQALLCSFVGVGSNLDSTAGLGVTGAASMGHRDGEDSSRTPQPTSVSTGDPSSAEGHAEECLCVLQGLECVKIYAPDGAEFEVALPCKAERMWALPRGLLIERAVPTARRRAGDEVDESDSDSDDGETRGEVEDVPSPMFFSLLHPLEELKPVSYVIPSTQAVASVRKGEERGEDGEAVFQLEGDEVDDAEESTEVDGEFMCDTKERILMVDKQLCLVVTHNEATKTHSVWALLPATAVNTRKSSNPVTFANTSSSSSSSSKTKTAIHKRSGEDALLRGTESVEETFQDIKEIDVDADQAMEYGEYDEMEDGLEDEDDLIESEVYMQRVWSGVLPFERADSVFVSHDPEGTPIICFINHAATLLLALSVRTESRQGASSTFNSPESPPKSSLLATPLPSLVKSVPRDRIIVAKAFQMNVRAAQPILCTGVPPVLDMVVLTMNNTLELHRGEMRLCSLDVVADKIPTPTRLPPGEGTSLGRRAKIPQLNEIVRLEHAVTNRVNLVFSNGLSLRVTTAMGFQSRILRPCIRGIDDALPADVSLRLRVDVAFWYDTISHGKDPVMQKLAMLLIGEQGVAKTGKLVDLEWAAFVIVLALLIKGAFEGQQTDNSDNSRKKASEEGQENQGGDWFNRMMSTDFHREYEQTHRSVLGHLSRSKPSKPVDDSADKWFELLDSCPIRMISNSAAFLKHIPVLVFCLHLVYEECKLSTLTWPLVRPIGALLCGICDAALDSQSRKIYLDHYARDLGCLEILPLPQLAEQKRMRMSKQSPPDLLDWVSRRLKRASKSYKSPVEQVFQPRSRPDDMILRNAIGLSASSAALSPFPELESCFRTQQVCCFFELLSGGTGDEATVAPLEFRLNRDNKGVRATSKSPVVSAFVAMDSSFSHWMSVHGYEARNCAERTVLGMVWFGFTLQELETLTFGLSVPLREALHFCRSNPSGRWPADAYVLVGREDMAALALAPPPPVVAAYLPTEKELEGKFGFSSTRVEQASSGGGNILPVPVSSSSSSSSSSALSTPFVVESTEGEGDQTTPLLKAPSILRTPVLARVIQQEVMLTGGAGSSTSSSSSSSSQDSRTLLSTNRSSVPSRPRRRASDASWSTVTTAVTPVWRRLPSGQGMSNQVAEDLLWGGKNLADTSRRRDKSTFLDKHQQRGQTTLNSTATSRLLSIADFARLSVSASAEVGQSGEDLFDYADDGDAGESRTQQGNNNQNKKSSAANQSADPSGFALLQRMTTLRFGSDRRVREVCRLLRSSHPVRLVIERSPEMSDHDLVAAQQAKLMLISRRTMSLPVGRGMITFGTVRPLLTDTVDIPPISLAAKIPPNNAVVKLDLSGFSNSDELLAWPRFHNGAAAGLRLSAGSQVTPLTRTWIAYNRPESPNHTHAGFLLALGLHGHLAALTMADIYEYLAQGHDATTVAIMLGLSAAKRGTMSPTVSKMLCLHIPSLLPAAFSDMEVPSVVQTSAIMGIGLLYQGTAHRLMTEFLLAEIGRRPTSDRCADRESYSLAAGLALGLVTLGYGAKPGGLSGLADLRLEDRLHRYMVGGLDPEYSAQNSHSHSASDPTKCSRVREGPYVNVNVTSPGATLALSFIFMKSGNESVATRLAIPDTHFLLDYVRPDFLQLRVIARNLVLWDAVEPSEEWLLSQVPPAIRFSFDRLAGGGTTAAAVAAASRIKLSHAPTADEDEEDLTAQGVIDYEVEVDDDDMDDSSEGTKERMDVDSDLNEDLDDSGIDEAELAAHTPLPPPPPQTPTRGSRLRSRSLDGTDHRTRPSQRIARLKTRGNSMASMVSRVTSIGEDSDGKPRRNTGVPVDEQAVRQAHANIVAGACMSIGLRFVGTASRPAQQVLAKYVRHFAALRSAEKDNPLLAQRPDKSTLEMCLGASAIALALVMAGTGDLGTLRLLRSLRFQTDESVSYGNHMSIGSAIGILFLGGGRMSFSNDNASIAALVCAFYPRFPLHTSDNQYHLQALRHLYVLATEERCLDAYDIDTRSPCYLPIEVTLRPNAMTFYADRVRPVFDPESIRRAFEPSEAPTMHWTGEEKSMAQFLDRKAKELQSESQRHQILRRGPSLERTSETVVQMIAPCLLPPLAWISSIRVASPRYWPMEICLDGEKNVAQKLALAAYRVLCVKRKVGHLSYMEDPQGVSSLLARPRLKLITTRSPGASGPELPSSDFMRSFTADPHVLAFAKQFCRHSSPLGGQHDQGEDGGIDETEKHFEDFCTATLYDCLTHEKPEMLNIMVDLYTTAHVFRDASNSFHIRNVKLLNAFYSRQGSHENQIEDEPLIDRAFLASLNSRFKLQVTCFDKDPSLLKHYLLHSTYPPIDRLRACCSGSDLSDENVNTLFATYLHFFGIPEAHVLVMLDLEHLNMKTFPSFALQNRELILPEALLKIVHALTK